MNFEPRDQEAEQPVFCRRLQSMLPVREHGDCKYCFGDKSRIRTGSHPEFCDYDVAKDPINFGFPPDTSRNLQG